MARQLLFVLKTENTKKTVTYFPDGGDVINPDEVVVDASPAQPPISQQAAPTEPEINPEEVEADPEIHPDDVEVDTPVSSKWQKKPKLRQKDMRKA